MMVLTKSEKLYFDRLKALGKLKPIEESCYVKTLKAIEKKLPLNFN